MKDKIHFLNIKCLFILAFLFVVSNSFGQTTIYSEDFSSNAGKGNNQGAVDVAGVTTWSISTAGVTINASEYFYVNNNRFEHVGNMSQTPATGTPCYWNANTGSGIDISTYRNVELKFTLGNSTTSSSAGIMAQISYDGTNYMDVAYYTTTASSQSYTVSNLQGTTLYFRVLSWTTGSSYTVYLDDVTVKGYSGKTTSSITSTGANSLTVPANVYKVDLYAWGGGGGGGVNNSGFNGGGGGGGGAFAYSSVYTTPGATCYYSVGVGGSPALYNSVNAATNGGDTWFNTAANSAPTLSTTGVLAKAGVKGTNTGGGTASGGSSGSCVGSITQTGGTGGNGGSNGGGGGGGSATLVGMSRLNVTTNTYGTAGSGSSTGLGGTIGVSPMGGNGGDGRSAPATAGGDGAQPGGGGGGSDDNTAAGDNGGSGGAGQLIICYYTCAYSGTYDVGPTGTFASITSALASIKNCGMSGWIILELQPAYTDAVETYPLDFSNLPTTVSNTLTIRPKSTVVSTITLDGTDGGTATDAGLFDFNGTDYVTIDGRLGGSGANYLTIENTNTAGGSAFLFSNDATNNTIKYCTLKSNYGSSTVGIVTFSTTTSTTAGNDSNTIDNCVIDGTAGATASPTGTGVARIGIYSAGTVTYTNSSISIISNEFKDCYNVNTTNYFIYLDANNDTWTITGNSFYQSNSRTNSSTTTLNCVSVDDGDGYTISTNYFGGSAASCSGTWTQTFSGTALGHWYGISLASGIGTTTGTSIQGNTFKGFAMTQYSTDVFCPIYVAGGKVSIGNTSANTIGSTSSTGSITMTKTGAANTTVFKGVDVTSASTVTISNNIFGSITFANAASYGTDFKAIALAGAGTFTVSSNVIGSTTQANSIQSTTATTDGSFIGVYDATTAVTTISSNTMGNITLVSGTFTGIQSAGASGANAKTISSNTIGLNTISNSSTSTSNQSGILCSSTGTNYTISSNTISSISVTGNAATVLSGILLTSTGTYTVTSNSVYSLSNSGGANNGIVSGINSTSTGAFVVNIRKNKIYTLTNSQTGASAAINGIYFPGASTGSSILINNYISIGANGTNVGVFGISAGTAGTPNLNLYYNTVEIKGSPTSGTYNSSAFYYSATAATHVEDVYNNIFYNSRSNNGSSGSHYCYYTGSASTITTGTVNNNFYYAVTDASYAYVAANKTAAQFQVSTQGYGGINSKCSSTTITINSSDGALSLSDALTVGFGKDLSSSGTYSNCQDDINSAVGLRASEGGLRGCYEYTTCGTTYTGPLTWAIGTAGDFPSITAAVWALKRCGFTGIITMEMNNSYNAAYSLANESYPINIDANIGVSSSKYIIIRPASGVTASMSGSNSGGTLLNLNNASYIQIDGQPAGTGSTSNLTITNTATAASSNRAIVLQGVTSNATNNTIKYCSISADNSSTTNTTAGVVFLGSSASGNNTSNTFSNNTITYASSANACGFVSYNSTNTNGSNTFSTNNIADFSERGIWLSTNSDQWTINDNSVYRVVGITGGTTIGLIYIEAGDQYTINGNYLGGTAAYCGAGAGTYFTATSANMYGIYLAGSGATATNIYDNYIKYLSVGSAGNNVYGIYTNQSSTTINIYQNEIAYIKFAGGAPGSTTTVYGSSTNGTSVTMNYYKNKLTNLFFATGGSNVYIYGADFSQTTTSTLQCYNNFVSAGSTGISSRTYTINSGASSGYFLNNTVELLTDQSQTYDMHCLKINASTTSYVYNNIFKSSATSATPYYTACIYYVTGATVNHTNNYYQNTGASSTCNRFNNTAVTYATWESGASGQSGTTMTLYSNGVVNANTAGVNGLGINLYSVNAVGSSVAITTDIVAKARPNGAMWIGCYEGTGNVYYSTTSVASTDASDITKWKTGRDNTGSSPSNFTTSGDVFIVQSGHKYQVTNTASFTGTSTGYVQVENGGALDINARSMNSWQYLKLAGTGVSSSGAFFNSSVTAASISVPVVLTADATITSSGTGGLTLTGGITGTGYALTISGSYATTISTSGINTSTSGSLVKSGSGTLTISASSDYTGLTTISAGVINIQNTTALGTSAAGTTVVSGAALQLQGAAVVSETLTLNGSGVSSDGAMRFISGTNSWSGAITLGAASRINSDAGTNTITGGVTGTGYALTLGGAGSGTISTTGINTSTAGTLTKDGAGTWTISATGTYTGTTTISAGVLDVQNATALGTTAAGTTVASGAALQLQGGITVGAEALTLNNDGVSSAGSLRNVSGANTWGGDITLSTNAVRINSDASTLTLSGTITNAAINLTCGGAGNITVNGVIGSGAGTLTKDGAGTLTLGATNTFTGAMTINAGTVTLAANQSLSSTLTISSGTLGISTYTIAVAGTSSIAGTLTISTGTYDANGTFDATGGTLTFSGAGFLKLGGATVTSLGTTFTCGSGTVDYDYAGAQNIIATSYNHLTTSTSGTKSLTGTTYIASTGVLTVNTGTTLAIGSYTLDKTTFGTSTSVIDGTVTLSTGTWVPTYGASSALTTNGTITVTGAGLIYLKGGGTHTLGTFNCGTGTVYYDRNGAQTVVSKTYYDIVFSNSNTKTLGGALIVTNDLTIDASVTLDVSGSNYGITITGNWVNNGTFTAQSGTVTFTGVSNKTVSGSSNTSFYELGINKGSDITSILDLIVPTTITYNVVFTAGLLRLTHASAIVSADYTNPVTDIASGAGLHVNGGSYTTGTNNVLNNSGYFRVTSGTATIGIATDNTFYNETATAVLIVDGGTLNCAGRLRGALGSITISSGTVSVNTVGGESIATRGSFEAATGSDLAISGGTIVLQTPNGNASGNDLYIVSGGTKTITGGTFQIGNASTAAAQSFKINSDISLYNLTINSTNSPTAILQQNTTVSNNFINGGVFDAKSGSNYSLTIGGGFTNNGTFTARTGTVTFNGGAAQTIAGTTDPNFYNYTLSNASGTSLSLNATVQGTFTFTSGLFTTQGYTLTIGTNGTNGSVSGYTSARYFVAYDNSGTIGYVKQFINLKASTAYEYPIGDLTNYTPFTFTVNTASTLAAGAYFTMYTKAATISGLNASVTTYLTRFWRGTDSGITTPDYDISYAYSASDVIAGTEANLMPIKKSGSSWYKPTGSTFTTGTAVGTGGFTVGTRTLTWTGLTSFSDYGGVGPMAVGLPIELTLFEGKKIGNNNELIWRTQTEINNDYFTIEKTTDGDVFETVGTQNGAGNSSSVLNYNLVDQNVQKVINYYRLIQTDTDGKNTISNLISIDNRELETTEKIVSSITNILGQEINDSYRGLVIITYTDGSSIKTIR